VSPVTVVFLLLQRSLECTRVSTIQGLATKEKKKGYYLPDDYNTIFVTVEDVLEFWPGSQE
jgi:hypothetical protein